MRLLTIVTVAASLSMMTAAFAQNNSGGQMDGGSMRGMNNGGMNNGMNNGMGNGG